MNDRDILIFLAENLLFSIVVSLLKWAAKNKDQDKVQKLLKFNIFFNRKGRYFRITFIASIDDINTW